MPSNISHLLPMSVVTAQLTQVAGHTVLPKDVDTIVYDPTAGVLTARVTLKPTRTQSLKTTEYFTFTRQQVVNFYNSTFGLNISASTILDIRFDPQDSSYVELLPAQT